MKQGNNPRRSRGRGSGKRQQRNNSVDSHGPEVRVRGTAQQVHDKYLTLARDATSSGDRIGAENYYQHAEHYYRIIAVQQENAEQRQETRDGGRETGRNRRGRNGAGELRPIAEGSMSGDREMQAADVSQSADKPTGHDPDIIVSSSEPTDTEKQDPPEGEARVERALSDSDGDTDQSNDQPTA